MQRDPDLDKKVMDDYIHGRGTIEQIAIFYKITIEEVLQITGNTDMLSVELRGDMVDPGEVGPDVPLSHGKNVKVPYQAG